MARQVWEGGLGLGRCRGVGAGQVRGELHVWRVSILGVTGRGRALTQFAQAARWRAEARCTMALS